MVKPVPDGYHSLTPFIIVTDIAAAMDWYKKAFKATDLTRMTGPDGAVMHGEMQIGNSRFMLGTECPTDAHSKAPMTLGGTTMGVLIYVDKVDDVFAHAVKSGAEAVMPVTDMFWGDRYGQIRDPFGHSWSIATHTADLTPAQIQKNMEAFCAEMAAQPGA
jgi:uncharacterized glyoxalase superfamily protein PhnB